MIETYLIVLMTITILSTDKSRPMLAILSATFYSSFATLTPFYRDNFETTLAILVCSTVITCVAVAKAYLSNHNRQILNLIFSTTSQSK